MDRKLNPEGVLHAMSKKRREKFKAKQRRHSVNPPSVNVQNIPPSIQKTATVRTHTAAVTKKPMPTVSSPTLQNKQLENASPLWKTFYSAISDTTL
jgi:hypothetical protein